MKNLLAIFLLVFVAACADNPLGIAEGMWVKHKIDGQKYYVTMVDLANHNSEGTQGYIKVKNEFGAEVDKRFPIHEFDLWVEQRQLGVVQTTDNSAAIQELIQELRQARIALDAANTASNRAAAAAAAAVIKEAEEAATASSPVFRKRVWNPVTQRYE